MDTFSGFLGQLQKRRGAFSVADSALEMVLNCLNQNRMYHGAVLSTLMSCPNILNTGTSAAVAFVRIFAFRPSQDTCGVPVQKDFNCGQTAGLVVTLVNKDFELLGLVT